MLKPLSPPNVISDDKSQIEFKKLPLSVTIKITRNIIVKAGCGQIEIDVLAELMQSNCLLQSTITHYRILFFFGGLKQGCPKTKDKNIQEIAFTVRVRYHCSHC